MKYNGTIWVAGGAREGDPLGATANTLAYSSDGLIWEGNYVSGLVSKELSEYCTDIAHSPDYWLAIGKDKWGGDYFALYGSTDGKTWSRLDH